MQDIYLKKYCLFKKEQINLFDFLAISPINLYNDNYNSIYKEFEKQKIIKKYGGEEKKINEIFKSYNIIRDIKEICFGDIKLFGLLEQK